MTAIVESLEEFRARQLSEAEASAQALNEMQRNNAAAIAEIELERNENRILRQELEAHHRSNIELLEKMQRLGFDIQRERQVLEASKLQSFVASLNDIKQNLMNEIASKVHTINQVDDLRKGVHSRQFVVAQTIDSPAYQPIIDNGLAALQRSLEREAARNRELQAQLVASHFAAANAQQQNISEEG